jgi:very-short-patch-repair endonuclease
MTRAPRIRGRESNAFDEFDELQTLLFRQESMISRRQALRLLSPAAVEHRLARGVWRLAHRSVYVAAGVDVLGVDALTQAQRNWVASLAAGDGRPAALGGVSALNVLGLRGFDCDVVHVVIPGRYRDHDPPTFAVVHRTASLPHTDVRRNTLPPCTVAGRSVVDAGQWAGSDARAAAIVAACFQGGLVTLDEVEWAVARQPRAKRRALVLDVARTAADGAHALPEVEFVRLCRQARLPAPKCQVSRIDVRGRWRHLDAYFEDYGVHVEIDGGQHVDAGSWWADMKRQNDLWVAGDRLLRFPSWIVRSNPAEVAAQVRAVLVAAGWRPRFPAIFDS